MTFPSTLRCLAATLVIACGAAALGVEQAAPPNVLLLCVDDLRPELACFGVDYIHSPNINRLAAGGVIFQRHYVQAPTCGASRFALLTGRYGPAGNGALFQRAAKVKQDAASVAASMPAWFRQRGYTTVSVGKVSHHPGGRGGKHWADDAAPEMPLSWDRHLMPVGPWQHPEGAMHGLANGEIRRQAKNMDVFQSREGPDTIYPDGLITDEALGQLDQLAEAGKPFFLAVGLIRPHLPFGAPAKYMRHYRDVELPPIAHPQKPAGKTTWHGSGEFMKYNRWRRNPNDDAAFATEVRKHYAACVSYADAQVGRILDKLQQRGLTRRTIVVLWGDHGWHLGEHAIWGKHALFEESLRSPLIISCPWRPAIDAGAASQAVVETIDLFPTLCELAGAEPPEFAQGRSLVPILRQPGAKGHAAYSYTGSARTIRTPTHRLIAHRNGQLELYDHESVDKESRNLAGEQPQRTRELQERIIARFAED